eukprot:284818641_2
MRESREDCFSLTLRSASSRVTQVRFVRPSGAWKAEINVRLLNEWDVFEGPAPSSASGKGFTLNTSIFFRYKFMLRRTGGTKLSSRKCASIAHKNDDDMPESCLQVRKIRGVQLFNSPRQLQCSPVSRTVGSQRNSYDSISFESRQRSNTDDLQVSLETDSRRSTWHGGGCWRVRFVWGTDDVDDDQRVWLSIPANWDSRALRVSVARKRNREKIFPRRSLAGRSGHRQPRQNCICKYISYGLIGEGISSHEALALNWLYRVRFSAVPQNEKHASLDFSRSNWLLLRRHSCYGKDLLTRIRCLSSFLPLSPVHFPVAPLPSRPITLPAVFSSEVGGF